jgi:O-antigen/teichoic acid export membrane protein
VGVIVLSKLADEMTVGIYNAALRPCSLLSLVAIAYANALFPLMSRLGASSRDRLLAVYQFTFKTLMLIALPMAVGVMLLARPLVSLAYGNDYLASIQALQILVWIVPAMFFVYPMGNVLIAIDKIYLATIAFVVNGIVAVGLNLVLIRKFGYLGASVAMVASELLLAVLYFAFIWKYLGKISISNVLVKPLLITALMGPIVFWVSQVAWPLSIPIGIIFCVGAAWVLRVFSPEERIWFRRLVSRDMVVP